MKAIIVCSLDGIMFKNDTEKKEVSRCELSIGSCNTLIKKIPEVWRSKDNEH